MWPRWLGTPGSLLTAHCSLTRWTLRGLLCAGRLEVTESNVQNFAAFTNLAVVGGNLKIRSNVNLKLALSANVGGIFPSLTEVVGDLLIENNQQLDTLSGFRQLAVVGSLEISRNSGLSGFKAGTFASLEVRQKTTRLVANMCTSPGTGCQFVDVGRH